MTELHSMKIRRELLSHLDFFEKTFQEHDVLTVSRTSRRSKRFNT
jgi:hypothetical protein